MFSFLNLTYQTKILESAKAISDYINEQKLDDVAVASNIFEQRNVLGDDPLLISRNFNAIIKNFRLYLIYAFILLLIFLSISWAFTNKLIHKISFKKLAGNFLNNFVVLFFYLGLIFLLLFLLTNISISNIASATLFVKFVIFLIFSIVLVYFMFISISLSYNTRLSHIVQKTLGIGIRKIHYIFFVYLINLLLISLALFLLVYFIEKSLLILLLSLAFMIFSFIFGRIFLIKVVEKLS